MSEGSLSVSLSSEKSLSSVYILLFDSDMMRYFHTINQIGNLFCKDPFIPTPSIYYAFPSIEFSTWNSTILYSSVFSIFLVNCQKKPVSGTAKFHNLNSNLDSRDQFLPCFYLFCCFVFIGVVILFFKNMIQFPNFRIFNHISFTFLGILYSISRLWLSLDWKQDELDFYSFSRDKIMRYSFPVGVKIIILFFSILSLTGISIYSVKWNDFFTFFSHSFYTLHMDSL